MLFKNKSLKGFIENQTNKNLEKISFQKINIFIFNTPDKCNLCNSEIAMDKAFIEKIKQVAKMARKKITLNYVIFGRNDLNALSEYSKNIKNNISKLYIMHNNKAKDFIYTKFNTYGTPFVLIVDENMDTLYWHKIYYKDLKNKHDFEQEFLHILEVIL